MSHYLTAQVLKSFSVQVFPSPQNFLEPFFSAKLPLNVKLREPHAESPLYLNFASLFSSRSKWIKMVERTL